MMTIELIGRNYQDNKFIFCDNQEKICKFYNQPNDILNIKLIRLLSLISYILIIN